MKGEPGAAEHYGIPPITHGEAVTFPLSLLPGSAFEFACCADVDFLESPQENELRIHVVVRLKESHR